MGGIQREQYNPNRDGIPKWAQEKQLLTLPWEVQGKKHILKISPTFQTADEWALGSGYINTLHPFIKAFFQKSSGLDLYRKTAFYDPTGTGGLLETMGGPLFRKSKWAIDVANSFRGEPTKTPLELAFGSLTKGYDADKQRNRLKADQIRQLLEARKNRLAERGYKDYRKYAGG